VLATVAIGVVVDASPAHAAGAVSATPATGLVSGQTITVVGTGWMPEHTIGFCQGVVADPPDPGDCDNGVFSQVTTDSSGNFTSSLIVKDTINVPSLGHAVDCVVPTNPCVLGAASVTDVAGTAVRIPLSFSTEPTVPGAPTIIRDATPGDTQATVSWTAPVSDGRSPITGYLVTPYHVFFALPPVPFDATATTRTVTGLTNGVEYRFRVQADNAIGTSGYSKVSNPVTPAKTVPGAPTIIRDATAADTQATVSWTAPASDGGSPITGYVVTPYHVFFALPPVPFDSTATTQTVTGLTNGVEYRFRVQAVNAIGTSGYSKVSNPATPAAGP